MTKLTWILFSWVSLAAPVWAAAAPDAFTLWQQGAFRGANVMQAQCTVEDLRALRSWGANLAEIPVSNVYAPTPPYAFQPENLAKLDRAVKAAEDAGLYVALTCREGPGRPDFNRSHEIWRDAAAQEAYAKMWGQIAAHYRGRPSIVGHDIMCEPHPDQYAGQPLGDWNALAQKITAAIRAVDQRTPILVNSIGWAYPQQFEVLRPTGDPRTVYTVHFYDPHYYTHQKPTNHVSYPGFRVPGQRGAAWDKAAIEARLAPVRAFQQKHRVPIFVGEFGCARFAPGVEEWMRDQIDLYEQYGWSWAYWAFREWDVMNIERTADATDKVNHSDTPLLRLFKSYFGKDKEFFSGAASGAESGFVPLFDGKTLDGWTVNCLPKDKELAAKAWSLDQGTILANTIGHTEHFYIMLVSQQEYGDFVLRLRLQVERGITGNSGIQIRSRYNPQTGWMEGPQIDINPPGPELTGKLWNEGPGPHRWLSNEKIAGQKFYYADQGDGWNDLEITAKGTRIKSVLNGVTVVDYDGAGVLDDELHRKLNVGLRGMLGLQIHSGHELKLRFKDIWIKPL